MKKKKEIYDKLCRVLTEYESHEIKDSLAEFELYDMLVEIQNNWEDVITAED